MSQDPVTVTYSLEEVLREIKQELAQTNQKLDNLQSDVAEVKIGQARLEQDVKNIQEDVKELKGASKAQIWTLIGILITAVGGFLIAVGRFVIYGNP